MNFSVCGSAKRLDPATAIKIQTNNLVTVSAGDFTHIFSEATCVWFVFPFTAVAVSQPLVVAGWQLQNNESLATSPIKVLQPQPASPPQQHTLC